MSAVNDATARARDQLAAAEFVLAGLRGQLAGIPGWLRIGDPERHADPGDQAAARQAVALAMRISRVREAVAQFAVRVEHALGDPPDSIWSWVTFRPWLESLPSDGAQQLLDGLVTSPERLVTGEAQMSLAQAQAILDYIAGHGGQVGDGELFRQGVPLDAADLADLEATGFRLRAAAEPSSGWDVLLPVRLETRFLRPGVPGPDPADPADADQTVWRLLVRVEPDAPSLATAPAPISAAEAALVPICWTECAGSLVADEGEAAFAKLAGRVGAARAAYLLRRVPVVRGDDGFALTDPDGFPERPPTLAEPLIGLPGTLEIWGGPEDAPGLLATLHPDRAVMAATATITSVTEPEDGQTPRRWWNSYAAARAVQLAVEIPFGPAPPNLPLLYCVGYDEAGAELVDLDELFGRHADAGRLGTLAPLTATNTVAGAPTVDLGRDPKPWWPVARDLPGPDGGLWASLTGQSEAAGFPAPDLSRSDVATSIITALWPVLWQRSLKDDADGSEDIWRLGEWAARNLHPFGPYPILRFGDLPYGVLPISAYGRWVWRAPLEKARAGDPRPEVTALAGLPVLDRPLLDLALAQGNAVGADTDRLLDLLEHVPTSRAYGSRQIPATVLFDALTAALGASAPGDQVRAWEDQFGYLRGAWPPGPRRRYSPVLDVEPLPRKVDPDYRELLRHYLEVSWSLLAEAHDLADEWRLHGEPPAVLARLIRQALLLTQAEVARLLPRQPPSFLLPLNEVEQFMNLASGGQAGGGLVAELPPLAQDLVSPFGADPRAAAVCRQFEDVRDAVVRLSEPEPVVAEAVLPAVLDLTGHRVDGWWTGLAYRRLRELAAAGGRPRLGCYGWVDDLAPNPDPTAPTAAGLIHAPGYTQALTAAVLRDQAVHHADQGQWQLTLESDSIRTAAALAEQVRLGVHLSEALGREIERLVGDPALVLPLRQAFPARPEWEGRRVCDGQQVLDAPALPAGIDGSLFDPLRTALDTYADLLVSDALHDVVEGRATAAAEALEASAGLGAPPELRLLKTQRGGSTVKTTALVAWSWLAEWDGPDVAADSPVTIADPALAGLLAAELPPPAEWTWTDGAGQVTLADLGLGLPDLVMFTAEQLAELAAGALGSAPSGGTGADHYRRLALICAALGGGMPVEAAAPLLLARLAVLRTRAEALAVELGAPEPNTAAAARRWGLDADLTAALDALLGRIDQLGPVVGDSTAGAETLTTRIRTLLPSVLALSLAVPQPATTWHPLPNDDWLEVVAAVRPSLARLEVAQLTAQLNGQQPWSPAASDELPVWAPGDPAGTAHRDLIIGYRPSELPGADPAREAAVVIDRWAETVPARAHTTWAAFGYDAPRARPQQAILLVVPPDVDAPRPVDDLRDAVREARRLTRIRAVRPPLAPEVSLLLPTSMIIDENVTPSGAVLAREA